MEPSRTMNLAVSAHFRCEHPNNQKQVHLPTTSLTPINYNNSDNNDNPKSQFDHLISGKTVNLIQSLYQITNQLEKIAAQSQSNPLPINHQTIQSTLKSSSSSSYLKQQLPAAGVFWDIENCALNRSKSFFGFVDKIRRTLIASRYRETEFVCVCDTSSIERYVLEQLNLAQVNVIHVNAGSKNAADDKLKQLMIRFAEIVQQPPTIILISSKQFFFRISLGLTKYEIIDSKLSQS